MADLREYRNHWRFVADDDLHFFAPPQQPDDVTYQNGRQIEIRGTDRQLLLGTGHQMIDGLVKQAAFSQTDQRSDGQLFIAGNTVEFVVEAAQILTELAGFVFNFRAGWAFKAVKMMHSLGLNQIRFDPGKQGIGKNRVADQLIAVVAVPVF